jgi:Ser/Thr protein kinase RdoA (MazF antagonist)
MNDYFYHITPEKVLNAIEEGGFTPSGHIFTLNSYENRVYDIRLDSCSHIVAKFYRPNRWTRKQILEEHALLTELYAQEIPVCSPLPFPDGQTLHEIEGTYFAVWPRTGGHTAHELQDVDLQILGRLLARIHNVMAAKTWSSRPPLSGDEYGYQALSYIEKNGTISSHLLKRYTLLVDELVSLYKHSVEGVPQHAIHADCHPGNFLQGSDGWFMLDFDDFCQGPAVQDMWMLIQESGREGLRRREILVEAYETFRPFDRSWFSLIEPLRALRFIRYAGWIARRWDDPVFPKSFPHFGTDDYWENEIRDLELQLKEIKSHPINGIEFDPEISEDEELTNKDFFWDME